MKHHAEYNAKRKARAAVDERVRQCVVAMKGIADPEEFVAAAKSLHKAVGLSTECPAVIEAYVRLRNAIGGSK